MKKLFTNLSKTTKLSEVFVEILGALEKMVQCHAGTIMVFGDDEVPTKLIKHRDLRMENTVLENKRIDILGLEGKDKIYDPFFKKLTTAFTYSKTSNYMIFPVYSLTDPDSLLISI